MVRSTAIVVEYHLSLLFMSVSWFEVGSSGVWARGIVASGEPVTAGDTRQKW